MTDPGLEITGVIGCPVMCKYCPQTGLARAYSGPRVMNFELFKHCIDKVPEGIEVFFAGFSEPLLHPRCVDMVRYARASHPVWFTTTLHGASFELLEQLATESFHRFTVHLQDSEMNIKVDNGYLMLLYHVRLLFPHARFRSLGTTHPRVLEELRAHNISVQNVSLHNRAGNLTHISNPSERRRCTNWRRHMLLPNGKTFLCCMDYQLKHQLGDLNQHSWQEIQERLRKLLPTLLDPHSGALCNQCSYSMEGESWCT